MTIWSNFTGGTDRSRKSKQATEADEEKKEDEEKSTWEMTYPSGERMKYTDGTTEELKPIMICLASDPETSQVFLLFIIK